MFDRKSCQRASIWLAPVLGLVLVVCAAAYGYWVVFDYRFLTVTEGEVYRSAAMPPTRLVERVKERGIRSVVDLREPGPDVTAERVALASAGVRHHSIPSSQVPDAQAVSAFLEVMKDPANRPVLIHCEHGIGRAPLFSALYRLEFEGWSNERARSTAYWWSGMGSFGPDTGKGSFLLSYLPNNHSGI